MHLANNKTLPPCPFGATCYRKNLLHFGEFSHPFNLLNPDDSDEEQDDDQAKKSTKKMETIDGAKKRKAESEDDGEKTEEYNSDDVSQ